MSNPPQSPHADKGDLDAARGVASSGVLNPAGSMFRGILVLLVIAAAIFATRWPTLGAAREGRVPNMDELYVAEAGVARALGVPGVLLQWPAGPVKSFVVAWLPADFLIGERFRVNREMPVKYSQYVAHQIEDPWRAVVASRWFVAIVSSLGFAALYRPLADRSRSPALALIAVALMATSPLIWMRSAMAVGDALSWAMLALACAAACSRRIAPSGAAILAGGLAGAALASKVTALVALPLPFFLLLQFHRNRVSNLLLACLALPFGYAIACPEALALPGAVLRGIVGNMVSRPGGVPGVMNSLDALYRGVPVWFLIAGAFGVVGMVRARLPVAALGVLACLGMSVASTYKAGFVEAHYLTPMCIACAIAVALGLSRAGVGGWIARGPASTERPRLTPARVAGLAVVCGLIAWNALAYRSVYVASVSQYLPAQVVAAELRSAYAGAAGPALQASPLQLRNGDAVVVDAMVSAYVRDLANAQSRREQLDGARAALADIEPLKAFVASAGLDVRVVETHVAWFNQLDQASVALTAAQLAWTESDKPGLYLRFAMANEKLARRAKALTVVEAAELFRSGDVAYMAMASPVAGLRADHIVVADRVLDPTADEAKGINPEDGVFRLWIYKGRSRLASDVVTPTTTPATFPAKVPATQATTQP